MNPAIHHRLSRRGAAPSGHLLPLLIDPLRIGLLLIGLAGGPAWGGSAYIYELADPAGIGYASVGFASRAQDAGTVFGNPAGMTRFDHDQLTMGITAMYLQAPFKPGDDNTVEGHNGSISEFFGGGNFAYIHSVSPKLKLGLSIQNFFGLSLNWNSGWVGRYESVKETLIAPQVQPTVAYKVNDWLSVGAGAAVTGAYLYTKKRIDNPSVNDGQDSGDGKLKIKDADVAVQGNIGIMIEPREGTRIGLRYLTQTKLNFNDNPKVSGVVGIPNGTKGKLQLGINMPRALNLSVFHQINDQWAVMADLGWEQWSHFGHINVGLGDSGPETTVDAGFKDVWHYGIAGQYRYSPTWMFTGGVAYDSSFSNNNTRPAALPLQTMYRYGAGFVWQKSKKLSINAGLSLVWEGDIKVKPGGNEETGRFSGHYSKVSFTFAGLSLNYALD